MKLEFFYLFIFLLLFLKLTYFKTSFLPPTPRNLGGKKAYLKDLQIGFKLHSALEISQSEIHKSAHV